MTRIRRLPSGPSSFGPQPSIPSFIDSALIPARGKLGDAEATRQMADDMRQAAYREGGMTRDGLQLLGYTADQIDRLGDRARQRALSEAGMSL